jgi:hypothetical protein
MRNKESRTGGPGFELPDGNGSWLKAKIIKQN